MDVTTLNLTGKVAEKRLMMLALQQIKIQFLLIQKVHLLQVESVLEPLLSHTSGFDEEEMKEIAAIISLTLKNIEDEEILEEATKRVAALTEKFPLYNNYNSRRGHSCFLRCHFL